MAKILFSFKHAEKSLQADLPAFDNPLVINEEDENGNYDANEDQRRFEQNEEQWHLDQEF